jgi:hypothetical protein
METSGLALVLMVMVLIMVPDRTDFDLLLGGDSDGGSNIGFIMGISVAVPVAMAVVVLVVVERNRRYLMMKHHHQQS